MQEPTPEELENVITGLITEELGGRIKTTTTGTETQPDEGRMPMVWDAWHKFPGEYSGNSRRGCLEIGELLPEGDKPGAACAKFPPNDSKFLEAAEWWHRFTDELVPRATRDRAGLVQEWLVYRAVESVNIEDIATYRTVQVLKLEEPGGPLPQRPSLSFIRIVRKWHEAFRLSRVNACRSGIESL